MRTQKVNTTSEKKIFLDNHTTVTKRVIAGINLTLDRFPFGKFIKYPLELISDVDKNSIVSSCIWFNNPSSSEIIQKEKTETSKFFKISALLTKKLLKPIDAILETDDCGFISRSVDLPLYGYGDDPIESIQNLKHEIESLYNDLMEDDNFSNEWLQYKSFLKEIIFEA